MSSFPVKQAGEAAPEGSVPHPRKRSGGEHSIMTSESAFGGHEESMNRMPDPNVEWTNEESGEGKG